MQSEVVPPPGEAPASPSREAFGLFSVLFVNLIWAASFPATAFAVHSFPPVFLTLMRLSVGGLLLSPWLFLRSARRLFHPRVLALSAFLGVVGFSLPVFFETEGLYQSTPAVAAISIAMEPLFTTFIAAMVLRERLTWRRIFALFLALIGAYAIAGFPRPDNPGYWLGDLFMLAAVLCYAVYNALSKKLTDSVPSMPAASASLLFGALGSLPIWLLLHHPLPHEWISKDIYAAAYLTLFCTTGAYVLWNLILRVFHASFAALFLYLQPVFGVLLSVWLLHIQPEASFYVGSVVILFSLFLGRQQRGERSD
ncbi:DMT family transporter [Alicyclobacillus tolerans]|uniref:Permease of the drug/metabolite transporter (DMT) superfamily n=1 Tax=Alicyclobacillus tolerans TaxID=90970 RepID=A0A1M6KX81_9BACL|nr:DMT family transporter [Alicyclobacillus montanus]SHJ63555.1 Permease of the drug/metabolite transporter (DMT) superfamily [Alicyclobacillus montanus]